MGQQTKILQYLRSMLQRAKLCTHRNSGMNMFVMQWLGSRIEMEEDKFQDYRENCIRNVARIWIISHWTLLELCSLTLAKVKG